MTSNFLNVIFLAETAGNVDMASIGNQMEECKELQWLFKTIQVQNWGQLEQKSNLLKDKVNQSTTIFIKR